MQLQKCVKPSDLIEEVFSLGYQKFYCYLNSNNSIGTTRNMAKEQEKKNTPSSKSSTTAGIGIKISQECFKLNNFYFNLNNLSFMIGRKF